MVFICAILGSRQAALNLGYTRTNHCLLTLHTYMSTVEANVVQFVASPFLGSV